jgi:hypothetical protein
MVPPLTYVPVAVLLTVKELVAMEVTVTLVKLYAVGLTPVMLTTSPTEYGCAVALYVTTDPLPDTPGATMDASAYFFVV